MSLFVYIRAVERFEIDRVVRSQLVERSVCDKVCDDRDQSRESLIRLCPTVLCRDAIRRWFDLDQQIGCRSRCACYAYKRNVCSVNERKGKERKGDESNF